MVARLRAKPGAATIGDFATTRVAGTFRVAYLVFNTIMSLTTQDEQVECFRNVAAYLEPGGCFVIEVMLPELQRLPPGETVRAFTPTPTRLGFDQYDIAESTTRLRVGEAAGRCDARLDDAARSAAGRFDRRPQWVNRTGCVSQHLPQGGTSSAHAADHLDVVQAVGGNLHRTGGDAQRPGHLVDARPGRWCRTTTWRCGRGSRRGARRTSIRSPSGDGVARGGPWRTRARSALRTLRRRSDNRRNATVRTQASGASYADTRDQLPSSRMNASWTHSSASARLPAASATAPTSRA
jgi:hypothetical protein